jgi:tRNA pseudouridine13 synthase
MIGTIRSTPADFQVEELPAYLPSGTGEHLYFWLQKRGQTTDYVSKQIAKALEVDPRDIGVAGLKDRHAVTKQWFSVYKPEKAMTLEVARERVASLPDVVIEQASRHVNKLRTGHLHGNRFTLVVRDLTSAELPGEGLRAHLDAELSKVRSQGVPNHFGGQRFGREGKNVAEAMAWLRGEKRPPRDAKLRRLLASAVQSEVFNRVLSARITDGSWLTPQEGEWLEPMRKALGSESEERQVLPWLARRGFFGQLPTVDAERLLASGVVSTTGPMFGPTMPVCSGAIGEAEARAVSQLFIEADVDERPALEQLGKLAEGTRRALRLLVEDLRWSWQGEAQGPTLHLSFALPPGGYATTVLDQLFEVREPTFSARTEQGHTEEVAEGDRSRNTQ